MPEVGETGPFKPADVIGGRFEVIRLLGAGGVGFVYLTNDRAKHENRALKVLRPEFAKNELAVQRFMREVRAARAIDHQGLVAIHDTGRLGDALFYTMEFVQGDSLSQRIAREGPLDFGTATQIAIDVCSIFEAVHKHAIHRDLSSDNVMQTTGGALKILDFGITRLNNEDSQLTGMGLHLGKQCYSAPEQMIDARSVDHRADLYSIAMLYQEMLSGRPTFGFDSPREKRPELPPEVDTVLQRGLANEADDRYPSAVEMREAFQQLAGSQLEGRN